MNQQPELRNILFLGDSLTAGYRLPPEEALPAVIQERLNERQQNYRTINAGISGDTTAGGLYRLKRYLQEYPLYAMVIELGLNDAFQNVPVSQIKSNLKEIITQARFANPDLIIFLVAMEITFTHSESYIASFHSIYAELEKSEKVITIPYPLRAITGEARYLQEDGFHPNSAGNKIMIDQIWRGLDNRL